MTLGGWGHQYTLLNLPLFVLLFLKRLFGLQTIKEKVAMPQNEGPASSIIFPLSNALAL